MIVKLLMCLMAFMPFTGNLEASIWDIFFSTEVPPEPKTIKVLIVHDKPGVVLEVKGKYALYDPNKARQNKYKHISTRFLGKRKFIQAVSDGIRWGEEFPGVFQLLIVPEEESTKTVVDGVSYKGSLYVYNIAETGTISIVNEVLLDDYINSVLSNQYKDKISEEAAAAIAITARTNALYYAENPRSPFWSVDATETGYVGDAIIRNTNPIVQAVESTKQMVMKQSKNNNGNFSFPASFALLPGQSKAEAKLALISTAEVENLAQKGDHAAEILKKAFPETSIQLVD